MRCSDIGYISKYSPIMCLSTIKFKKKSVEKFFHNMDLKFKKKFPQKWTNQARLETTFSYEKAHFWGALKRF